MDVAKRKMLFIYNPKAGKSQIRAKLAEVVETFAAEEFEVVVCPTRRCKEACELMEKRDRGYELVVCSGGDGTLDEVVTGMMKSGFKTPIGYIPAGSTNDFGGSLGLPKNIVSAAKIAVKGKNFACDVGKFNDDIFVYIAAFGIFTEVSYGTDQGMKNAIGYMAYVMEGVKSLQNIRSHKMKVRYRSACMKIGNGSEGALADVDDGKTKAVGLESVKSKVEAVEPGDFEREIEDEFIFGMITNSVSVGGFKSITGKHVKLDDGVFEVTLVKSPKNPMELNNIMVSLLNRNIDAEGMYCFTASHLEIEAEDAVAWTLDGEFGGEHKKVEINNCSKAMDIRVK